MKKSRYIITLLALSMVALTSCKKVDAPDLVTGQYIFYEPIMNWDYTEADVRSQMDAMSGWERHTDVESDNELCYINDKTNASMRYDFENGVLRGSSVHYFDSNDKFEQMKNDWAEALDLTWTEKSYAGFVYYEADCKAKHCTVTAQKNTSSGIDYMIIDFNYTEFFW